MRKNHFDMMSMMSPKGWLGGSDKSSGKLFSRKSEQILLKSAKIATNSNLKKQIANCFSISNVEKLNAKRFDEILLKY